MRLTELVFKPRGPCRWCSMPKQEVTYISLRGSERKSLGWCKKCDEASSMSPEESKKMAQYRAEFGL